MHGGGPCWEAVRGILDADPDVAGMIIEPVQAEGGDNHATPARPHTCPIFGSPSALFEGCVLGSFRLNLSSSFPSLSPENPNLSHEKCAKVS